ncbi:hypothetical protein WR25_13829 [Diploscapter pachys]|uniref:7TM GPCR serpentine receptor class x (Srx) domain-containing protein n=1 Tax=Diploscapter pachys TaxID=2018661 RepID=A0A2A2KKH2_9BILA|nr:hypothetical protein WR25_13829 [Diploscapter pachys]
MAESDNSNAFSDLHLFGSESLENAFCAFLLFFFSLVGILANVTSAAVILHLNVFNNGFGLLAAFHAFSNCGVLLVICFWSSPAIYFGISPSLNYFNHCMGQLAMFFWSAAIHSIILVSINRFIGITFPSHYRWM